MMEREVVGNPIEAALLRLIEAVEGSSGTFRSMHPLVCEIPYSPIIKFRLSIHECADYQVHSSNELTQLVTELTSVYEVRKPGSWINLKLL